MLKEPNVRRGCTVPSPLTWPFTKKSDGTRTFVSNGSVDGCSVLTETQFVGICLCVDTTQVLSVEASILLTRAAGERSKFNFKPHLGAPLLIFPQGYLLKSFKRGCFCNTAGFQIIVFPLLGELPNAISHLPFCLLYRWQCGPSKWSTTKSFSPIVLTALWVGFPAEILLPATGGFAYNCSVRRA